MCTDPGEMEELPKSNAIVAAVAHEAYLSLGSSAVVGKLKTGGVFADVKSTFESTDLERAGIDVWRL